MRAKGKRKIKKTWRRNVRRDPQSSMNECGTWDRDSRLGRAKREAKSNVGTLPGKAKIIYTALKVRKRGLDLCGKSVKGFREVSSSSKGRRKAILVTGTSNGRAGHGVRKKSLCSTDTSPYSPPQKHLPGKAEEIAPL